MKVCHDKATTRTSFSYKLENYIMKIPPHKMIDFLLLLLSSNFSRGFGFITFSDPASVEKVLSHGSHELDGKKV